MTMGNMTANVTNVTGLHETSNDDGNFSLGITYLLISILVMSSNSVVILVIVLTRELHLPTLWNLAFMAAWDFFFGLYFLLFVTPSALINSSVLTFAYSTSTIAWAASLGTFQNGQNPLNVVLAVLDRYIAICWPMKYAQIITLKRFIVAVIISIILNTTRTLCIVFPDLDFYYNPVISICISDFNTALGTLTSIIFTTGACGVIFICLIKIILDITRTRRRVHPELGPPRHIFRFSFTIAFSAGVFCLSYVPLVIVTLCNYILGKENIPIGFFKFSMVCLLSNSLWNVIIYAITYRPFRDALLRLSCKTYYRRQRQIETQSQSQSQEINSNE